MVKEFIILLINLLNELLNQGVYELTNWLSNVAIEESLYTFTEHCFLII